MKTLGIVHVPRDAHGVESKFARKLGGKSLLEFVIRRVTDCQWLDGVVVVPGEAALDDVVRQLVPPDVATFCGPQTDALARFAAAARQFKAGSIVRICAHAPFVDPVLIDRLVTAAAGQPACDYLGYCRADGRPAMLSQVGIAAEWCSTQAICQADRETARSADRDHPMACLLGHPDRFRVRLVPLPVELDRDDMRLRVDLEEDWEHAQVIYDALAHDEWDWQRVADLLDHQPALRKRMAALNRAGARP
ncbi:MAG: NTP transferase domain-containing protein [Pirellulales bacterium]